jgi:hypothetical protein
MTSRKFKAKILEPTLILSDARNVPKYEFEGLVARRAVNSKGLGVYATVDVPKGTMLPILGNIMGNSFVSNGRPVPPFDTHHWEYHNHASLKGIHIDGADRRHDLARSHRNVAAHGLALAMLVNEPSGQAVPNCIFKFNYLVVVKKVSAGKELLVYYGPAYAPVRAPLRANYTVSARAADFGVPEEVQKWTFPSAKERREMLERYLAIIQMLGAQQVGLKSVARKKVRKTIHK